MGRANCHPQQKHITSRIAIIACHATPFVRLVITHVWYQVDTGPLRMTIHAHTKSAFSERLFWASGPFIAHAAHARYPGRGPTPQAEIPETKCARSLQLHARWPSPRRSFTRNIQSGPLRDTIPSTCFQRQSMPNPVPRRGYGSRGLPVTRRDLGIRSLGPMPLPAVVVLIWLQHHILLYAASVHSPPRLGLLSLPASFLRAAFSLLLFGLLLACIGALDQAHSAIRFILVGPTGRAFCFMRLVICGIICCGHWQEVCFVFARHNLFPHLKGPGRDHVE